MDKYIYVLGGKYIFKRYVNKDEMELFRKHRGAKSYYFKTTNSKNKIAFYVRNTISNLPTKLQ